MGRFDFLYKMDLQHRAVAVFIYLADRANRDGECWPAIPTIARELKLSQSTVRRALQDLRKAELLETGQRYRAKGGKSGLLFWLRKVWQVKGTTQKRYYRQIKNSDAAILDLTGCFNRGNPCGCRNFSLTTTPSGNMLYLAA